MPTFSSFMNYGANLTGLGYLVVYYLIIKSHLQCIQLLPAENIIKKTLLNQLLLNSCITCLCYHRAFCFFYHPHNSKKNTHINDLYILTCIWFLFFIVLYQNYCFKILTNILHRCLVHVCAFCIQQYQFFFNIPVNQKMTKKRYSFYVQISFSSKYRYIVQDIAYEGAPAMGL